MYTDRNILEDSYYLVEHFPDSMHRSLEDYLAQVKKWKNYPTLFDGVFS